MHGRNIFLSSGSSVRMSMDIKETDKPADRMAFCTVQWAERESGLSPVDRSMMALCNLWNGNWAPRFSFHDPMRRAYSANTEFVDYFYQMYWHRDNWTSINTNFLYKRPVGFTADPGTDEWNAQQAMTVFTLFCREDR
jgi:hypothetical protein